MISFLPSSENHKNIRILVERIVYHSINARSTSRFRIYVHGLLRCMRTVSIIVPSTTDTPDRLVNLNLVSKLSNALRLEHTCLQTCPKFCFVLCVVFIDNMPSLLSAAGLPNARFIYHYQIALLKKKKKH